MTTLPDLRSEFPFLRDAATRLEELLANAARQGDSEYTIQHLYEIVHPDSIAALVQALQWLIDHRYIDQIVRVMSPSGVGLADFASIAELPREIIDDADTGETLRVTDANVEVLYKIKAA